MNKRTLLFIVLFVASLFAINQYFIWNNSKRREELISEMKKQDEMRLQELFAARKISTPSLSSLPLTTLYEDTKHTKPLTLAVQQENQYLTVAWSSPIPHVLYDNEGKELFLQSKRLSVGDPALYSTELNSEYFVIASPPSSGEAIFQLVYFTDNNLRANVTLGVMEEGRFLGTLNQPSSNCIALFLEGGNYLPYGIYHPASSHFSLLTASSSIPHATEEGLVQKKQVEKIAEEKFYVLENNYIQLVFSNIGGSLAEINLPLRSPTNTKSVVLPIDIDQKLQEYGSKNDKFPLDPYYKPGNLQLTMPTEGGYYPLLRRSLFSSTTHPLSTVPPRYYALNLFPANAIEDTTIYRGTYRVTRFEDNLIEFELSEKGRKLIKTYALPKTQDNAPYSFELTIRQKGNFSNLELTSGIPEVELVSDSFTPSLKYRSEGKKAKVAQVSLPKEMSTLTGISPSWISDGNGFFGVIINPLQNKESGLSAFRIPGEVVPTRLSLIDPQYKLYPADKYPGYELRLPISANHPVSKYRIFAGPYEKEILEKVDAAFYDATTDSSPQLESVISFHGWFSFISEPFAKFLFFLMKIFYFVTGSWGFSIILLTVALRVMLYPLNTWSIRSTMKMQEIGPQVQALQARYKKDPKRAQMEIMHLYREKGINPLSGCFPLLIQLPFLIGMFDLLKSTFVLRGTQFIPGWIDNLIAPDVLFSWNYPIFFIGTQFHLLPILLGLVMYLQQKYSSSLNASLNSQLSDQQRQQKFMGNIMTIVFTLMFYNFPSGLNIYWLSSMLLGILQQWLMVRKQSSKPVIEVLK